MNEGMNAEKICPFGSMQETKMLIQPHSQTLWRLKKEDSEFLACINIWQDFCIKKNPTKQARKQKQVKEMK